MKDPRAVVAVILASSVFIFVVSGTFGRVFLTALDVPIIEVAPEIAAKWENILSVIVGVLAGYVMGRNNDDAKP